MADEQIVEFLGFTEVRNEIERLRTELTLLVAERDELLLTECANLKMRYLLELGGLEYAAYDAQCAMLLEKRRLELIQAARNRQEPINLKKIDESIKEEMNAFKEKLREKIAEVNAAMERSKCEKLSDSDAKELKKLYRQVVKALHPDLHPNVSDEQKKLFNNAVAAYESGDLEAMRLIAAMSDAPELDNVLDKKDTMTALVEEKERLEAMLDTIRADIARIKANFPYIMKELLNDPERLEEQKTELADLAKQYKQAAELYRSRAEALLAGKG